MPADIRRDSCLRRLIRLQGPDIIKIITGIRGCGKTYLLFTQFRNYLLCSGIDESRIIEDRQLRAAPHPGCRHRVPRERA